MSRKPIRVITDCVAEHYTSPNERTVEFAGKNGTLGGLINFHQLPESKRVSVVVFNYGPGVDVTVGQMDFAPGVKEPPYSEEFLLNTDSPRWHCIYCKVAILDSHPVYFIRGIVSRPLCSPGCREKELVRLKALQI